MINKKANWLAILLIILSCSSKRHENPIYAVDMEQGTLADRFPPEVKKFGLGNNDFRQKMQIPLLPDSFYLERFGGDYVGWHSNLPDSTGVFLYKSIVWEKDGLVSERNYFVGPNSEKLIIWYGKSEINPVHHFDCSITIDTANIRLSRFQADSILLQWKLVKKSM